MKISPISTGGTNLGNINIAGPSASSSKIAAAKAAFMGQAPATPEPEPEKEPQNVRKITMRTNVSPDRYNPEPAPESTTSVPADVSGQAEPAVEAIQPLSPQFAALAKQRRAIQVKEMELAKREAALKEAPQDGTPNLAELIKTQPLKVLKEHGVTYDQLTEAILAEQAGASPEIYELKQEIKALKEGLDKGFSERDQQAEQQVLNQLKLEAEDLVKQGDDFELVRIQGKAQEAVKLVNEVWKKEGKLLDISEALAQVEALLVEDAIKLTEAGKIKSRFQQYVPPAPAQQPAPVRQMRTLTNRDNATPVLGKRERAIAAMLGQLKR